MKYSKHFNPICQHAIVDDVWVPSDRSRSNITPHQAVQLGELSDTIQRGRGAGGERRSQPSSLLFVPLPSKLQILGSLRAEDQRDAHGWPNQ
jgi:hypothetical protein